MHTSSSHAVSDIFTPTTPARLTFVERPSLNDKLVNAIRTPGKQIVVYGHSGSGKTTLLVNKLHQLKARHINSRCMRGTTLETLLLDAFDQLAPFYVTETQKTAKTSIIAQVSAEYAGVKNALSGGREDSQAVKRNRVVPVQLTAQSLGRFLGAADCCWVIEDFHKVEATEKVSISQLMKVFMDMADNFKFLKIIALGAVGTARQVVEYDAEMRNRVAEIHVPLMTGGEVKSIIEKGEQLLNVVVIETVKKAIVHYSNGLASVCHHLCLNLCVAANVQKTSSELLRFSPNHFKRALAQYLDEASDTLKHVFDKAFRQKRKGKYPNCKLILKALSECPQEGETFAGIYEKIGIKGYPTGNLTLYLSQLQTNDRGSIIRHDTASGTFAFADPIYRAFCLAYFSKESIEAKGDNHALLDIGVIENISTMDVIAMLSKQLQASFIKRRDSELVIDWGGGQSPSSKPSGG